MRPQKPPPLNVAVLAAMLDSANTLIACVDTDFNFIHVNKAYAEADGRAPSFYLGKNHFELFPDEENEQIFRHVRDTAQPYSIEAKPFVYAKNPERGVTYWNWSLLPITNDTGMVTALVLTLSDVTEQTVAEQQLRESKASLQAILDNTTAVVCVKDKNGRFLLANRRLLDLFGCTEEEFIGKTNYDFLAREHAERIMTNDRQVLESNQPGQFEEELVHDDGSVTTFFSVKVPLRNANGEPYALCGISTDITAKKRAERMLEEYADTVADTAPVLVMTINPQGKIARVNRFTRDLTGYAEDELIGSHWRIMVAPHQHESLQHLVDQAFGGEVSQGLEVTVRGKNGRHALIRSYSALQLDPEGEPVGLLIIGVDITEVKQKQEQLRQAAKMEAIGRLAGGIAHDFNNYLTAITGYANLLVTKFNENDPVRQDLNEITRAAESAAHLTRQLLAFGRQAPIEPEVLDLHLVVNDLEKSLAQVLQESIKLVIRHGDQAALVYADVGQIQQVVLSLAINARDAMPGGGTLVISIRNANLSEAHVRRHPNAKPGPHVELSFADTGTGIDKSIVPHIFEPFFTTKPTGEGSGLGLATVHGIVTQNGGHVIVESTAGAGTTFRVFFPAASSRANAPRRPGLEKTCASGTETILVAEDDDAVRAFTVRALQCYGYRTLEAASPVQALRMAKEREEKIDLLVSDVIMPELNGLQLAEALRRSRPDLPALFVSGYTKDALPERNIAAGNIELLTKPFTIEELCRRVRFLLDGNQQQDNKPERA